MCSHSEEEKKEIYKKLVGVWRVYEKYTCKDCGNIRIVQTNYFKYDKRDKEKHELNIVKED